MRRSMGTTRSDKPTLAPLASPYLRAALPHTRCSDSPARPAAGVKAEEVRWPVSIRQGDETGFSLCMAGAEVRGRGRPGVERAHGERPRLRPAMRGTADEADRKNRNHRAYYTPSCLPRSGRGCSRIRSDCPAQTVVDFIGLRMISKNYCYRSAPSTMVTGP